MLSSATNSTWPMTGKVMAKLWSRMMAWSGLISPEMILTSSVDSGLCGTLASQSLRMQASEKSISEDAMEASTGVPAGGLTFGLASSVLTAAMTGVAACVSAICELGAGSHASCGHQPYGQ